MEKKIESKNKISNSKKSTQIEKLYKQARKAHEDKDKILCIESYAKLLSKCPDDWEPRFYVLMYDSYLNLEDREKRRLFATALVDLSKRVLDSKESDNEKLKTLMKMEYEVIFYSLVLIKYAEAESKKIQSIEPFEESWEDFCFVKYAWIPCLVSCNLDKNVKIDGRRSINDCIVDHCKELLEHYEYSRKFVEYDKIINIILSIDPTVDVSQYRDKITKTTSSNQSNNSSRGCYVATCIYGSYDCPEVWLLRRFRDYSLSETWYGKLFIKLYYAISPTCVKLFGNMKMFRLINKKILDKIVGDLKSKGYSSNPYNDKF